MLAHPRQPTDVYLYGDVIGAPSHRHVRIKDHFVSACSFQFAFLSVDVLLIFIRRTPCITGMAAVEWPTLFCTVLSHRRSLGQPHIVEANRGHVW